MKANDGFNDNAKCYIVAWDFDGTLTTENKFPDFGPVRKYAYEVLTILSMFNVKNVIWTCRDDVDVQPLEDFMVEHSIPYDSINSSIQFAPFHYEARKIYAHMYVDDRAYGWVDKDDILIDIMKKVLVDIVGISRWHTNMIARKVRRHGLDDACKYIDKKYNLNEWGE